MDDVVRRRLLLWILRFTGGVLVLAAGAIFMPTDWMIQNHRWLGLGEFPQAPLTDYLTRSISAVYAIHGVVLLALSAHLDSTLPVVRVVGLCHALFGVTMVGIDLHAGMPGYWTAMEGPPAAVAGLLIYWLAREK